MLLCSGSPYLSSVSCVAVCVCQWLWVYLPGSSQEQTLSNSGFCCSWGCAFDGKRVETPSWLRQWTRGGAILPRLGREKAPPSSLLLRLRRRSSVRQFSRSFLSDILQPHGLQHARLPCPSPAPRIYSNSCPLSR